MKEKKARVEDALHATRAAVEEGIVPGGGVALLRAKVAVAKLKGDNHDQEAGIKIVLRAMEQPLREIVFNAGEEPSVVVNAVVQGSGNYGYNAATSSLDEAHPDIAADLANPREAATAPAPPRHVSRVVACSVRGPIRSP